MSHPPQLVPLRCNASGQNFYSYSTESRADGDGKRQCPECGKPVRLMAMQTAFRHYIPTHNKEQHEPHKPT